MATSPTDQPSTEVPLDTTMLPPIPQSPLPSTFTTDVPDGQSGTPTNATINPTIRRVRATENQAITRTDDRLDETNWTVWRHRLMLMLQICGVQGYTTGIVKRPDPAQDPEGAANWDFNTYARVLISNNVTTTQMAHISQSRTSCESWSNLEAVHDAKSHQTTIGITRNLYRTSAEEGDNISEHLNKLKRYWERINLMADDDFKVSDNQFKVLISSSLPSTWDTFMEAYVGRRRDVPETDPKKLMSSQQFIGIIKEEAIRRDTRRTESSQTHQCVSSSEQGTSKSKYCVICKRNNHNTSECRNKDKKPCDICSKFHGGKECWYQDRDSFQKGKRKRGGKQKGGGDHKRRKTETNVAEDEESNMHVEEVTFMTEEDYDMDSSNNGQFTSTAHVNNMGKNNKSFNFYDWFADSATTSHICNQKEAFVSYQPVTGRTVAGVGNNQAIVEGRGTIELESIYNDYKYLLRLENVLHIPSNRNNLISLGRWDHAGGRYTGGGGGGLVCPPRIPYGLHWTPYGLSAKSTHIIVGSPLESAGVHSVHWSPVESSGLMPIYGNN